MVSNDFLLTTTKATLMQKKLQKKPVTDKDITDAIISTTVLAVVLESIEDGERAETARGEQR